MLKVLKSAPGVSEPRMGYFQRQGKSYPFLEYRAAERTSWIEPTRFEAMEQLQYGHYGFLANLPGIAPLDMHVTDAVMKDWEAQCGVLGFILTD
jgi:hypothetical protein